MWIVLGRRLSSGGGSEPFGDFPKKLTMRHRFHSLCPYFAMFPESFVRKHLTLASTKSVVLDCFSGRGTTVFEALQMGHQGLGIDVNPLAVCVSRAKSAAPTVASIRQRIEDLETRFGPSDDDPLLSDEFFRMCFAEPTLQQILFLRRELNWRDNQVDCFIAAMAAGCLHGESHRSQRVFSNRMPRTISTKPSYSVRWWRKHELLPPERNVFEILRAEADFRFACPPPHGTGVVIEGDARKSSTLLADWARSVDMVLTSPPYLDVTHFREDQWLRVWFLGGEPFPCSATEGDDRHANVDRYWQFLAETWAGVAPLLKDTAQIVIRIGGKKMSFEAARAGLEQSLFQSFSRVSCLSESTSDIRNGQLRSFRPNAEGTRREFDFVFSVTA
ncbi:site-specific DNA-methyltransferase [Mesorhizobium sp. M0644]|uniref:DNA methyltransferase n=1 Tax=unclassified Mesorhizobium TaxID=325217 RepID=UPI003334BA50